MGKRRRRKMAAAISSANWAFVAAARRGGRQWGTIPLSCSSGPNTRKLVLYSKPGCCLCDCLKEKLQAAFSLSGPDSLHHVTLQVFRNLTTKNWCPILGFSVDLVDWFEFVKIDVIFVCHWTLLGKRYHYESWLGKGLSVWDTSPGQREFWWQRGVCVCLLHFNPSSLLCRFLFPFLAWLIHYKLFLHGRRFCQDCLHV